MQDTTTQRRAVELLIKLHSSLCIAIRSRSYCGRKTSSVANLKQCTGSFYGQQTKSVYQLRTGTLRKGSWMQKTLRKSRAMVTRSTTESAICHGSPRKTTSNAHANKEGIKSLPSRSSSSTENKSSASKFEGQRKNHCPRPPSGSECTHESPIGNPGEDWIGCSKRWLQLAASHDTTTDNTEYHVGSLKQIASPCDAWEGNYECKKKLLCWCLGCKITQASLLRLQAKYLLVLPPTQHMLLHLVRVTKSPEPRLASANISDLSARPTCLDESPNVIIGQTSRAKCALTHSITHNGLGWRWVGGGGSWV
jgi:hypothetical protein